MGGPDLSVEGFAQGSSTASAKGRMDSKGRLAHTDQRQKQGGHSQRESQKTDLAQGVDQISKRGATNGQSTDQGPPKGAFNCQNIGKGSMMGASVGQGLDPGSKGGGSVGQGPDPGPKWGASVSGYKYGARIELSGRDMLTHHAADAPSTRHIMASVSNSSWQQGKAGSSSTTAGKGPAAPQQGRVQQYSHPTEGSREGPSAPAYDVLLGDSKNGSSSMLSTGSREGLSRLVSACSKKGLSGILPGGLHDSSDGLLCRVVSGNSQPSNPGMLSGDSRPSDPGMDYLQLGSTAEEVGAFPSRWQQIRDKASIALAKAPPSPKRSASVRVQPPPPVDLGSTTPTKSGAPPVHHPKPAASTGETSPCRARPSRAHARTSPGHVRTSLDRYTHYSLELQKMQEILQPGSLTLPHAPHGLGPPHNLQDEQQARPLLQQLPAASSAAAAAYYAQLAGMSSAWAGAGAQTHTDLETNIWGADFQLPWVGAQDLGPAMAVHTNFSSVCELDQDIGTGMAAGSMHSSRLEQEAQALLDRVRAMRSCPAASTPDLPGDYNFSSYLPTAAGAVEAVGRHQTPSTTLTNLELQMTMQQLLEGATTALECDPYIGRKPEELAIDQQRIQEALATGKFSYAAAAAQSLQAFSLQQVAERFHHLYCLHNALTHWRRAAADSLAQNVALAQEAHLQALAAKEEARKGDVAEEARKSDVAVRFHRLMVLHRVTQAWLALARAGRVERETAKEEGRRRAKITDFLSRWNGHKREGSTPHGNLLPQHKQLDSQQKQLDPQQNQLDPAERQQKGTMGGAAQQKHLESQQNQPNQKRHSSSAGSATQARIPPYLRGVAPDLGPPLPKALLPHDMKVGIGQPGMKDPRLKSGTVNAGGTVLATSARAASRRYNILASAVGTRPLVQPVLHLPDGGNVPATVDDLAALDAEQLEQLMLSTFQDLTGQQLGPIPEEQVMLSTSQDQAGQQLGPIPEECLAVEVTGAGGGTCGGEISAGVATGLTQTGHEGPKFVHDPCSQPKQSSHRTHTSGMLAASIKGKNTDSMGSFCSGEGWGTGERPGHNFDRREEGGWEEELSSEGTLAAALQAVHNWHKNSTTKPAVHHTGSVTRPTAASLAKKHSLAVPEAVPKWEGSLREGEQATLGKHGHSCTVAEGAAARGSNSNTAVTKSSSNNNALERLRACRSSTHAGVLHPQSSSRPAQHSFSGRAQGSQATSASSSRPAQHSRTGRSQESHASAASASTHLTASSAHLPADCPASEGVAATPARSAASSDWTAASPTTSSCPSSTSRMLRCIRDSEPRSGGLVQRRTTGSSAGGLLRRSTGHSFAESMSSKPAGVPPRRSTGHSFADGVRPGGSGRTTLQSNDVDHMLKQAKIREDQLRRRTLEEATAVEMRLEEGATALALLHYHRTLLLRCGIQPWLFLIQMVQEQELKADVHYHLSVLNKIFGTLRTVVYKRRWEVVTMHAVALSGMTQIRKGRILARAFRKLRLWWFAGKLAAHRMALKALLALQLSASLTAADLSCAAEHYEHVLLRKILLRWRVAAVAIVDRRVLAELQERHEQQVTAAQSLLRHAFKTWRGAASKVRESRETNSKRDQTWAKINGWLGELDEKRQRSGTSQHAAKSPLMARDPNQPALSPSGLGPHQQNCQPGKVSSAWADQTAADSYDLSDSWGNLVNKPSPASTKPSQGVEHVPQSCKENSAPDSAAAVCALIPGTLQQDKRSGITNAPCRATGPISFLIVDYDDT
eukprot:gene6921-30903_t